MTTNIACETIMGTLPMSNNHHFIRLYHFLYESFYRLDIMLNTTFIRTFQKILKSKQISLIICYQFFFSFPPFPSPLKTLFLCLLIINV